MSINWVMLKDGGKTFVPLPREKVLYTSPSRTTITIQTPNSYPGRGAFSIASNSGGTAYVTNQRVVYLPSTGSTEFQSFSAPILHLLDSRVTAPWFGANTWEAVLKPVSGGGIPPQHAFVEVKLTFREGGAYDFRRVFEEVKERVANAAESARAHGRPADLSDVPLEPLPAYEASARNSLPIASDSVAAVQRAPVDSTDQPTPTMANNFPAPQEPPPGYEEAQSASVAESFEERIRQQHA